MSKSIESINKILSSIFDKLYNKLSKNNGIIKPNNIDNNNMDTNIDNNMDTSMETQMYVVPGHYKNKFGGSDGDGGLPKLDVIRVYGPDPKREGFWICDDNKPRTDSNILDNYVLMDLVPSKHNTNDKSHLFKDFEPVVIEPSKVKTSKHNTNDKSPLFNYPEPVYQQTVYQQPTTHQPEVGQPKEYVGLDIAIIERLKIDTFNKNIIDKYGDTSLCKQPLDINIDLPISFEYDLPSLRKTIELLNLDEKVIADYLSDQIIEYTDFKLLLNQKIVGILRDFNYGKNQNIETQNIEPVIVVNENTDNTKQSATSKQYNQTTEKIEHKVIPEKLNNSISDIDSFIEGFLNKPKS